MLPMIVGLPQMMSTAFVLMPLRNTPRSTKAFSSSLNPTYSFEYIFRRSAILGLLQPDRMSKQIIRPGHKICPLEICTFFKKLKDRSTARKTPNSELSTSPHTRRPYDNLWSSGRTKLKGEVQPEISNQEELTPILLRRSWTF